MATATANTAGETVVDEAITLDAEGHMVGQPHLTVHAAAPEAEPATASPEAPAIKAARVLTQKDHVPFSAGVGGEFVLTSDGLRVPASLYEESL